MTSWHRGPMLGGETDRVRDSGEYPPVNETRPAPSLRSDVRSGRTNGGLVHVARSVAGTALGADPRARVPAAGHLAGARIVALASGPTGGDHAEPPGPQRAQAREKSPGLRAPRGRRRGGRPVPVRRRQGAARVCATRVRPLPRNNAGTE